MALQNPPPPGNSKPFCRGSMDIFWNHTIYDTRKITAQWTIITNNTFYLFMS